MTGRTRALFGFVFGLVFMITCVSIFHVNDFDYNNMQHGTQLIWQGVNPWAPETYMPDFYNPPFAALFLWPMIFMTPRIVLTLGGALLFAFAFYHRTWVALAWFATNSFLYLIAAGGIDMLVMGGGLLLLLGGDHYFDKKRGLLLRILGYGLLLVKPQGTIIIVALYILVKRDWKGALISLLVYGLPFLGLFPDWLNAVFKTPPLSQTVAAHTILKKFGWQVAIVVALLALMARRWRFWQIGAALGAILSPYGMPAVPIFLVFASIPRLAAIPVIVLFSGCIAALTWLPPPPGMENIYEFINPLLSIYHLTMLGLALSLACLSKNTLPNETTDIDVSLLITKNLPPLLEKYPALKRLWAFPRT